MVFWPYAMDSLKTYPVSPIPEMLQRILDRVGDSVLLLDRNRHVLFVNDELCRSSGFTQDDFLAGIAMQGIPADVVDEIDAAMLSGAASWKGSIPLHRKSCIDYPMDAEAFPVGFDDDRKPTHYAIVMREFAETDGSREKEKDQLTFMEQLVEAIPNPVFAKDVHGRYMGINMAFEAFFDVVRGNILGHTTRDLGFFSPETNGACEETDRRVLETRGSIRDRRSIRFRDGRTREILYWVSPFLNWDGEVVGILGVIADITDLHEKELELAEARSRAEAEMRSKTMFLANMSHEIRTPLNALVGLSHLLGRMELGRCQRQHAEKIQTAGLALQRLVDDMLDFTRIEEGRIALADTPFRMQDILRVQEVLFGEKARAKGIGFVVEADPGLVHPLSGDATRLGQIMTNLAENAVKFTSAGDVGVACRIVDRRDDAVLVRFSVTDTGIGMSAEQSADILRHFRQGDGSITRRFGGTGLGLSISKKLVEIMGGTLQVHSILGEGSVFHFEIWFRKASEDSESFESLGDDLSSRPAEHALRNLRILLVEDDEMNRVTSSDLLAAEGANVVSARHGKEALEILENEDGDFDLVLMDIEMPVMDGFETVRRMKSTPLFCAIPVVAMTAHSIDEDWARCLEVGMLDHVLKPFGMDDLREAVLRWTARDGGCETKTDSDVRREERSASELDWRSGVRKARGNGRIYQEQLRHFLKEQGDSLVEVGNAVAEGARDDARMRARGLRTAAGIVGASELQRRARTLELALSGDADVAAQIASAARSLMRLVREIFVILEEDEERETAASVVAPPPDAASLDRLCDLLRRSDGGALDLYDGMESGLLAWMGGERGIVFNNALRSYEFDKALMVLEETRLLKKDES